MIRKNNIRWVPLKGSVLKCEPVTNCWAVHDTQPHTCRYQEKWHEMKLLFQHSCKFTYHFFVRILQISRLFSISNVLFFAGIAQHSKRLSIDTYQIQFPAFVQTSFVFYFVSFQMGLIFAWIARQVSVIQVRAHKVQAVSINTRSD